MRVIAAIVLICFTLGSCGGGREPPRAERAAVAEPPRAAAALSCAPWPDGVPPPADPGLLSSAAQDVPGIDGGGFGTPPQVTVGLACVTPPAGRDVAGLYCGAAERGGVPRPCVVGEECAIGAIMVTEVSRFAEPGGVATCAVFENWSKTQARNISVWLRTR
ncbi:MAG: hypothetical protein HY060_09275 [Proteobacteria bacterium]|nr:hypothetical protein [Pseudomonadota bacterium]